MLPAPTLLAVFTAIITVVMATLFFCCWRKKEENEEAGPEKVGQGQTGSTPPPAPQNQNGSVKEAEKSSSDAKDEVGDFSAVQREEEILRPYRKPPPPRNRGRQSRAGRAMTKSTEHLDMFGDIIEDEGEESARSSATVGSDVKIVLTAPSNKVAGDDENDKKEVDKVDGNDKVDKDTVDGDVSLRDKTGKEGDTRDARSSMLADIEQTLMSMRRLSAETKSQEDPNSTTGSVLSSVGEKEQSDGSGKEDDEKKKGTDVSGGGDGKENAAKTDVGGSGVGGESDVKEDSIQKSSVASVESGVSKHKSDEGKDVSSEAVEKGEGEKNKDVPSAEENKLSAESPPQPSSPKASPASPGQRAKGPKVSPKPTRTALAKAGVSLPLMHSDKEKTQTEGPEPQPAAEKPKTDKSEISETPKTDSNEPLSSEGKTQRDSAPITPALEKLQSDLDRPSSDILSKSDSFKAKLKQFPLAASTPSVSVSDFESLPGVNNDDLAAELSSKMSPLLKEKGEAFEKAVFELSEKEVAPQVEDTDSSTEQASGESLEQGKDNDSAKEPGETPSESSPPTDAPSESKEQISSEAAAESALSTTSPTELSSATDSQPNQEGKEEKATPAIEQSQTPPSVPNEQSEASQDAKAQNEEASPSENATAPSASEVEDSTSSSEVTDSKATPQESTRRESEDGAKGAGKGSKIPVRAGAKSPSSPPASPGADSELL